MTDARVTQTGLEIATSFDDNSSARVTQIGLEIAALAGGTPIRVSQTGLELLASLKTISSILYDSVAGRAITNADYRAELYDQTGKEITGMPTNVVSGTTASDGTFSLIKPSGTNDTQLLRIIVTSDPDNAGAAIGRANDDTVTFT